MKSKKIILTILFVLSIVMIYFVLYNKIYQIKVNTDKIYEIEVKTSDDNGLISRTITKADEIKGYMEENALKLKFTHPKFNTGKGWVRSVNIKIRKTDGGEWIYRYTVLDDRITIGLFQYKIISQ